MRCRNLRLASLALGLLMAGTARSAEPAPPPVPPEYAPIDQALEADLAQDIGQFDGIDLSAEARQKLAASWLSFLRDPSQPNPLSDPALRSLQTGPLPAPSGPATPLRTYDVPALSGQAHTIPDVDRYAADRLGTNLAQLAKQGKVSVRVYGGEDSSLAAAMKGRTLVRIPTLYDSWGIEKFLDVTPGQAKPTVIFKVPPLDQYVQHYGMVVRLVGGDLQSDDVNVADRAAYLALTESRVEQLYKSVGGHADYLVLGYGQTVQEELQSGATSWKLASAPVSAKVGPISGTLFDLVSKKDPNVKTSLLTLENQETDWGEGTSFLVDGGIQDHVRGVVFLGSAGAVDPKLSLYDVTVPSKFQTAQGTLPVENDLNVFRAGSGNPALHYGIVHGHTVSPAAETHAFVTGLGASGVGTVDVEEDLVAKTVADHDAVAHDGTQLLAANVITDSPGELAEGKTAGADLDQVDAAGKQKARKLAVGTVLDSLEQRKEWEANADKIRIQGIEKALPGIAPANIVIQDGQGRIDADPVHKLSYFVFTANPYDPESKTLLIPMATSRFDKYNYQTDDWWDAHKAEMDAARLNHTPMPHQDPAVVEAYLKANGLSTNPDVFSIDSRTGAASTQKLEDFLLNEYVTRFSHDGFVTIYRGASKATELGVWKSGQFPGGVRYWTPSADYGWRYGRKVPGFFDLLVKGQAPVLEFKIPTNEFVDLVKRGHLILGTEMTKAVHDTFTYQHRFMDQLTGFDYMGDGKLGLELEIRGDRVARQGFARYFKGALTIDELADARIQQIQEGTNRLVLARPADEVSLLATEQARIARVQAERSVLNLMRNGADASAVAAAVAKLPPGPAEIASSFGGPDLATFAKAYAAPAAAASCATAFGALATPGH